MHTSVIKFYTRSIIKLGVATLVLIHQVGMYAEREIGALIHHVNLVFHEAGHALFIFFGRFLNILGGTALELGIPALIAGYFYYRRDWLGTSFGLWWLSTALMSVGIYASDARAQVVPLLGGNSVGHDWNNLLTILNILQYDQVIGYSFFILSLLSTFAAFYFLWRSLQDDYAVYLASAKSPLIKK